MIASLRRQLREQQDGYRAQINALRSQIRHLDRALAIAVGTKLAATTDGPPADRPQ